jgi:hypothetical protein
MSISTSPSSLLRLVLLGAALVFSAGSAASLPGYADRRVEDVTIVTAAEGAASGLQAVPVTLPFGPGTDGNQLVVRLLQHVRAQGGRYVSNVEIQVTSSQGECVTRVVPREERVATPQQVAVYRPPQQRSVLRPVTRQVHESQYRCHPVQRMHTRTETHYEYSYDYSCKCSRSRPVTRTRTEYRTEQQCRSELVSRTVTRYEYQYETQYQPPEWRTELRWVSHWELDESEPECRPALAPGGTHVIRALMYREQA